MLWLTGNEKKIVHETAMKSMETKQRIRQGIPCNGHPFCQGEWPLLLKPFLPPFVATNFVHSLSHPQLDTRLVGEERIKAWPAFVQGAHWPPSSSSSSSCSWHAHPLPPVVRQGTGNSTQVKQERREMESPATGITATQNRSLSHARLRNLNPNPNRAQLHSRVPARLHHLPEEEACSSCWITELMAMG